MASFLDGARKKHHRGQQKDDQGVDQDQGRVLPFSPEQRGQGKVEDILLAFNPGTHLNGDFLPEIHKQLREIGVYEYVYECGGAILLRPSRSISIKLPTRTPTRTRKSPLLLNQFPPISYFPPYKGEPSMTPTENAPATGENPERGNENPPGWDGGCSGLR